MGTPGKWVSNPMVLLGGQRYPKHQLWKCLIYTYRRTGPLNVSEEEVQDCQGPCVGWRALHITKHAPSPVVPGRSSNVLQGAEVFLLGTGDFFLIALALPFLQV